MSLRTGAWIVGARGSIGSALFAVQPALQRDLAGTVGMLTELPAFKGLPFMSWDHLTLGGCDVSSTPLREVLEHHVREGVLPHSITGLLPEISNVLEASENDILRMPGEVEPGHAIELLTTIRSAIRSFKDRHRIERLMVVNCASTEAVRWGPHDLEEHASWDDFEVFLATTRSAVPWGVMYAAAALLEGCAYLNFTPNVGTELPALSDLALRQKLPHAGKDGKTGETLLKSVLAPLFAERALRVRAWQGYNLLGNNDGRSLTDPAAKSSKIRSKSLTLENILGEDAGRHTGVGIEYVPSLGDCKTAWNLIHFEGFLGVKMSLQFTWSGFDTTLALPLVLDLLRWMDLALQRGERGALGYLASYFKTPLGCSEYRFHRQMDLLYEHFGRLR